MRLLIQTQGLSLSRDDRDQIRSRLRQALARFGQKALGVTLHVRDINGPRGGQDKDCHLVVELEDTTAVINDRGADLRAVVNRAIHRAMQTVSRQLKIQRQAISGAWPLRRAATAKRLSRREARGLMAIEHHDV